MTDSQKDRSDPAEHALPASHTDPAQCTLCGALLTEGRCLSCENQSIYRFVHREIVVLVILAGVAVGSFLVTRSFASSNDALRLQDGQMLYTQGQEALDQGHLDRAVLVLRRAVAKAPGDLRYRRALVRALIDAHQDESARQLLLELRDQQPEDSETNLQLARLEARRGDQTAARRYYQTAIIGLSRPEDRPTQRQIRTEFIEFLLSHGERGRALSELLVLEANLPEDALAQLAVARMMLAAGDARRALDHFERVLREDAANEPALAGAGEASFDLGDYARAQRYLHTVKDQEARVIEFRTLTDLVLNQDPLAPRLPISDRLSRLAVGVRQVMGRLETCRGRPPAGRRDNGVDLEPVLADIMALDSTVVAPEGPWTTDQIESGLDLVARAERLADQACGSPDLADRALELIARRHGLEEQ